jgi:hypothetical protein
MGKSKAQDAAEAVLFVPDLGNLDDLGAAALALLAVVVVAIVVVPLVLFGVELILLGLLVAAGIAGRALLGRPWLVRATPINSGLDALNWRVVGWRRSNRVIEEIVASLGTGRDPRPAEPSDLLPSG